MFGKSTPQDSVTGSGSQKLRSSIRRTALISTLLLTVSAPLVAYAISDVGPGKSVEAAMPLVFERDPFVSRYIASNAFQRVQYEQSDQQQSNAQQSAPSSQTPSSAGQAAPSGATRTEKDLLGEKQVPADAYYGVQTARALENFQISPVLMNTYPEFVDAFAIVKLAAARANTAAGAMKPDRLAAIEKAYEAIRAGRYRDQFKVDWYQGGAGTSANMNANEVMANVGLELSGHQKGEYQYLDPHNDLNMSQSTNDSYPTAIKVAFILRNDKLIAELEKLVAAFRAKGNQYLEIPKMGRTELQDAVPMTVGQEFHAFAASLECGDSAAQGRGEISLFRQHGRDRHRQRHQRAARISRSRGARAGQASPANRSCPPPTCSRPPGISRASSSIPRRSRAWRSSCLRSPAT